MLKISLKYYLWIGSLFWIPSVSAQMFGGEVSDKVEAPSVMSVKGIGGSTAANKNTFSKPEVSTDKTLKKIAEDKKQSLPAQTNTEVKEELFIPENAFNMPTKDGSKRGGAVFSRINDKGQAVTADNKIFLYYKNFKIHRSVSGRTSCDISIFLVTNLDRRLVNLDVKLVWPGLSTTVSFADVQPNTQTYYNYALMGDGCYTLDKMPNIIVNRCRVKGMSSAQCASNIVWLSSNK